MQKLIASPAVFDALLKAGLLAQTGTDRIGERSWATYGTDIGDAGHVICSLVEGQTIGALASPPSLVATAIAERGGHRASFNVAPYLAAQEETELLALAQAGWRQQKDGELLMETLHHADGVEPEVTAFLEKMSHMIAAGVDEVYWRVEIAPDAGLAWLEAARPDIAAKIAPASVEDAEEEQAFGMGM